MGTLRKIVAFLIVTLFTLTGMLKLMPFPSAAVHHELKHEFSSRFTSVFPLAAIGIRPDPDVYRAFVGIIELGCALLIIAGIPKARLYALFVLLVVMIGAIYSHIALHDPVNKITPAVVALLLILTLLYLDGALSVKIKTN